MITLEFCKNVKIWLEQEIKYHEETMSQQPIYEEKVEIPVGLLEKWHKELIKARSDYNKQLIESAMKKLTAEERKVLGL